VFRDILEDFANFTNHPNSKTIENSYSIHKVNIDPIIWNLFFYGSKCIEGEGVGCILKDPIGKGNLIAFRIMLQCTNNIVEHESLLQGLRKEVGLGENKIKVVGDSNNDIRKIRNTIHYLSSHIKHY